MTEVVWRELLPELHIHLSGAPEPVMVAKLREAARAFCEVSEAYRVNLDAHTVIAGVSFVALDIPTGTMLKRVMDLWYDGCRIDPTSVVLLNQQHGCNWGTDTGTPQLYYQERGVGVRLYPIPNNSRPLIMTGLVSLKPTRIATGLPDWLVDDWYEGIVAGAVARLKVMPDTEWYDPASASMYSVNASAVAADARSKAQQDDQAKDRRTSYGGY